jgi:hypothetical protein
MVHQATAAITNTSKYLERHRPTRGHKSYQVAEVFFIQEGKTS